MTEIPIPMPLCVWCGKPWTHDMMKVFAQAELDAGYYPGDPVEVEAIDCRIDVTCSSCNRLVYRKEIRLVDENYSGVLRK